MKRFISVFAVLAILLASFSACDKGEGVPFVTTKSQTTTAVNTVTVTFPEGFTVPDIAKRLEEKGVCSAESFIAACKMPREGIQIDNADERVFLLEGYLFPDTYEFYLDSDAESVISKFIENFNVKIDDEIKTKAAELGYSIDEILNLAATIQKECDKDIGECANVSSVFHNRMNSSEFSMLQSDVNRRYITKSCAEYLGYRDGAEFEQQDESVQRYLELYDTYKCKGLPAGPVCNPGIKAIRAAVNPAETDYFYFLSDPDGNFYYAHTYSKHKENGRKAGIM